MPIDQSLPLTDTSPHPRPICTRSAPTECRRRAAKQQHRPELPVSVCPHHRELNEEEGDGEEREAGGGNIVERRDGVQLDSALLEQDLDQGEAERLSGNGAGLEDHTDQHKRHLPCKVQQAAACQAVGSVEIGALVGDLDYACAEARDQKGLTNRPHELSWLMPVPVCKEARHASIKEGEQSHM